MLLQELKQAFARLQQPLLAAAFPQQSAEMQQVVTIDQKSHDKDSSGHKTKRG
jgi:hypothetical protein